MPNSPEVTWPGPANSCPAQNSWSGPVHMYTLHRLTTLFTKRQRARGKITVKTPQRLRAYVQVNTQTLHMGWIFKMVLACETLKWFLLAGFSNGKKDFIDSSSKIRWENLECFWRSVMQSLTTYRRGSGQSFTYLASKEPKLSRCLPRTSHEPLKVCG